MRMQQTLARRVGMPGALLVMLACGAQAFGADTYNPANGQLTIPTLVIGNATYSNVVVNVASILSGPAGTAPVGPVDTYNPANGQLTVQSVTVGAATVYNVIVTVSKLVSIGSVTGADTFVIGGAGPRLTASVLESNYTFYSDVLLNVSTTGISVAGGMPAALWDTVSGTQITVPAVEYGGKVYTNVTAQLAAAPLSYGDSQTITVSQPVASFGFYIKVGASTPIAATSSSGLPVSYVVNTPNICTVVQSSSTEAYAYLGYTATGVSGSFVIGAAPIGGGVYIANYVTGTATTPAGAGQILGLAEASPVLNPLPSTGKGYVGPYPNFILHNILNWIFDNALFDTGGPIVDEAGIALTATGGDAIINIGNYGGYYYVDTLLTAANINNNAFALTFSPPPSPVNGIVGLAGGVCTITAFQPGNGSTIGPAVPVQISVDVGSIILP